MSRAKGGWVEKYRPEDWSEVQGNNKTLKQVREWIRNWSLGDEPLLFYGPPGTGKTTTAFIAADDQGYPLNKVNLSEKRRGEELEQVARSTKSSPPDVDFQLVLLDEIDNMYHSVNKRPLYEALRSPRNPIIVTANDEYQVPDPVKSACQSFEYKLNVRSRRAKLKEIADKEGVDLAESELKRLAERPDLRSAINDLQYAAESDVPIGQDDRTWAEGEFPAMDALLSGDDKRWRKSVGYSDETFDGIGSAILWADENLSQEFRGLEAGVAYQTLASADYWAGQAWTRQDFRFQKYGWALLSMLPETRLSEPYGGYINVSFPQWFRASQKKHDGSSPEAKLYDELKGGDRGYGFAGSFYQFTQVTLPILQDMDEETRRELALNHGLSETAIEGLGLSADDFEDWRDIEPAEAGDGWSPDTDSAADASW